MKTKPFDPQAAMNGAKMAFDGIPVRFLAKSEHPSHPYVLQIGLGVEVQVQEWPTIILATPEGRTWRGDIKMILDEPNYPDWVIKSAQHHGCKWIAQDKSGAIYGFESKPCGVNAEWVSQKVIKEIVSCTAPRIDLGMDWTDSLFEVPEEAK